MNKYEFEELEVLREFMRRMESHFPADHDHSACIYCDMGEAGYSVMGKGTHDNECPYRTIQCWKEMFGPKASIYREILENES